MKTLSFITLTLTLSACCVLFNAPYQSVLVVTDTPCKIEVSGDTASYGKPVKHGGHIVPRPRMIVGDSLQFQQGFIIRRSAAPIKITLSNDSFHKTVVVKQRLSETFWLNFNNPTGVIGMAVDLFSEKKFKYPKVIFISSQNTSGYLNFRPVMKPYKRLRNIIKFTPLKSIDLVNPGVEFSYERITGMRTGSQIMASQLTSLHNANTMGFRFGFEERFYLRPTAPAGPYVALEFNYLNTRYSTIAEFGKSRRDTNIYIDSIRIFKRTYNYNIKLGFQTVYKHFCFDAFIGIGVRYKNAIHYDRRNPNDIMIMPIEPSAYSESIREGRYYTLSFPMNLRVGWLF